MAPLVVLVLVLAGCGQPEGPEDPTRTDDGCDEVCEVEARHADHFCVREDVRPRLYAPDTPGPDQEADPWELGDWWEHSLHVDGEAQRTRMVYYADQDVVRGQAQHYMVGATSREEALEHALFDVNPVLGRIHRELYSPHESGVHADMFNFPLCEGSQWSTRFFDRDFDLRARPVTLTLPDGEDPRGFLIEGQADDGSTLEVAYSPQAQWFTRIEVERADGRDVALRLVDLGSGHSGEAFFLRGQQDEVLDLDGLEEATVERTGDYDTLGVWMDLRASGDDRVEVHLRSPDGSSAACVGAAGEGPLGGTDCPARRGPLEVPWQEGEWQVTVERGPLGQVPLDEGGAEGEVRLVSIQDRSGRV